MRVCPEGECRATLLGSELPPAHLERLCPLVTRIGENLPLLPSRGYADFMFLDGCIDTEVAGAARSTEFWRWEGL